MYQKLIIIGNLGRDPELRHTSDGTPVCSFSVAVNRKRKDRADVVTWFRVSAWRKLAEICNEYLTKGRRVLCEGEVQEPRPYQGKDGEWRASLDMTARNVQFLGGQGEPRDVDAQGPRDEPQEESIPF